MITGRHEGSDQFRIGSQCGRPEAECHSFAIRFGAPAATGGMHFADRGSRDNRSQIVCRDTRPRHDRDPSSCLIDKFRNAPCTSQSGGSAPGSQDPVETEIDGDLESARLIGYQIDSTMQRQPEPAAMGDDGREPVTIQAVNAVERAQHDALQPRIPRRFHVGDHQRDFTLLENEVSSTRTDHRMDGNSKLRSRLHQAEGWREAAEIQRRAEFYPRYTRRSRHMQSRQRIDADFNRNQWNNSVRRHATR